MEDAATVEAVYRWQSPTAFDANEGSLTLALLSGVATGAFDAAVR
jgi:hypothetical protein